MSGWTDDDRARFDEAKRIIKRNSVNELVEYISGLDRETIDRLDGHDTCVTHHYCDCTAERIKELVAECDRLLSANDTLVERINDLTEGYALEDTCPRVQCRTTSQRLHRELAVAREHCIEQGRRIEALQDERDGLRNGNRDLHEECQRLRRERDDVNNLYHRAPEVKDVSRELRAEVAVLRGEQAASLPSGLPSSEAG